MFPTKVDIGWIEDNSGLLAYPCEVEIYSAEPDFTVKFCYPYSEEPDTEFSRFLTRVLQERTIPDALEHRFTQALNKAADIVAQIRTIEQTIGKSEILLVERLIDVYGLAELDPDIERRLTIEDPLTLRQLMMQHLSGKTYEDLVQEVNKERIAMLKLKAPQE